MATQWWSDVQHRSWTMMSPLSQVIWLVYIDELETYMDKINKDIPCLFAILLYATNVVLLSKSRIGLQRLLNKRYEFCTSSSLKSVYLRMKLWYLVATKGKQTKRLFYLDKDQIEKYKYLGYFDIIHMDTLSHLVKGKESHGWKPWWALWKEIIVGVTCWELKSHFFKALVLPTFTHGTKIWGDDLKNSHWRVFKKGMKMHMISPVKVCSSTT